MTIPVSRAAQSYYKDLPDARHRTGDIWTGFPTFGLFPNHASTGVPAIVITPACDLSNSKSHTITYLPILTIRELLSTYVGYALLRPIVQSLLRENQQPESAELLDRGELPDDTIIGLLEDLPARWRNDDAKTRFQSGVRALRCLQSVQPDAAIHIRATLPKRDWQRFREGIVRNSYADDFHFLPPEHPQYDFSAVREPSVVLLRYPMTLHRRELDFASEGAVDSDLFRKQPLKVTRLEREFLADLLTRFARLYVRLGSTDFTGEAVNTFANNIDKAL